MTDRPNPDTWRSYAREAARTVRAARRDHRLVDACRAAVCALPSGACDSIATRIMNLLYEEPANADPADLRDLTSVLERLEAGASHEDIVAHLDDLWSK